VATVAKMLAKIGPAWVTANGKLPKLRPSTMDLLAQADDDGL
jgi:hypothetical protein